MPTLTRGLSATALIREGDVFLFDCGEGTQLQLMRSGVKRSRIHSIFIGHLHGDHLYAFYQVPQNARPLPIVMLHGAYQSARSWETTSDAREGPHTL